MKKLFGILASIAVAVTFSSAVKAADLDGLNASMNVRFLETDNGTKGENRWGLHAVEMSVSKEVDNIGGLVTYRLADSQGAITANNQSYPVEAKVYYKFGKASKLTGGLQFVPFAIYKWNNLYNPFMDTPGENGMIWDADWGALYTYDAKPILLDIGFWDNGGETNLPNGESPEKNTLTARIGYDILPNLNLGASVLDGQVDLVSPDIVGDDRTNRQMWALDATWGIVPNLVGEAEYVSYDLGDDEGMGGEGDLGLLQMKWDILKVPAPLNKISLVGQYSWNDPDGDNKTQNFQEEIVFQAGKNLSIFVQNIQEKYDDNNPATDDTMKCHYIAFKYNLF